MSKKTDYIMDRINTAIYNWEEMKEYNKETIDAIKKTVSIFFTWVFWIGVVCFVHPLIWIPILLLWMIISSIWNKVNDFYEHKEEQKQYRIRQEERKEELRKYYILRTGIEMEEEIEDGTN